MAVVMALLIARARRGAAAAVAAAVLAPLCGCGAAPAPRAAGSPTAPATAPSAPVPAAGPSSPRDPARRKGHRRVRHLPVGRRTVVPAEVSMPDRSLTPGAVQSSDTSAICTPGWASAHRHVSWATEDAVAAEYGLASHDGYEIDHLIPLELGGANSMRNLWPQPYGSRFGAIEKDGLEDWLHDRVCFHGLPLRTAQHEIAANWYLAWLDAGRPKPSDFGYLDGPGGYGTTPAPAARAGAAGAGAWCRASAAPASDGYGGDYDVFVRSNQPDRRATVSDAGDAWYRDTDGAGSAEIRLWHTRAGETIGVAVGAARCSTRA
jgi:hypothetical protein